MTADYNPDPPPHTNCREPLIAALEGDGWQVDVVTRRIREGVPGFEEHWPRRIWRIDDIRTIHTIRVNEGLARLQAGPVKWIKKISGFVSKGLYYVRYCLASEEPRFAGWNVDRVIKQCEDLLRNHSYSLIMSVSYPSITHKIAAQLKETTANKIPWILYEFDPYSFNEALYGKRRRKRLEKNQRMLYEKCSAIFTILELYDYYQKTPFKTYRDKMYAMPYANLKEIEIAPKKGHPTIQYNPSHVNCIFAGTVRKDIRDPQYAVRVFGMAGRRNVRFHMLTGSNGDFFREALHSAGESVRLYPAQPREEALAAMRDADVLVNIGNSVSFQPPGKIFEYMSMGKPIIHFRKIEEDPCLKYFQNYPMVLILDEREDTPQKHAELVADFCKKVRGETIEFGEVEKRLSEYANKNVARLFLNTIYDLISGK